MSVHQKNISDIADLVIKYAPLVNYDYPEDDPGLHVAKKEFIDSIKKLILGYLERYIESPDYLTSIRWFYTQKLIDFTGKDPLLPYNKDDNEGLYYEMEKLNAPNGDIVELSSIISERIKQFNPRRIRGDDLSVFSVDSDIQFQKGYTKFKITSETYNRLRDLYSKNNGLDDWIDRTDRTDRSDRTDWMNYRIFNLLCRYESLAAPGYHAAIPEGFFNTLKQKLKVNHEIFASPFNCNVSLNSYTSAYPDTDKFFGSKGNFFGVHKSLFKNGGSFEANPPFLEEHMAAFSKIVTLELESNIKPLSFVIIYPTWEDSLGHKILKESKYNVTPNKSLYFDRGQHYYIQSSQYWNKDKQRKSNSCTSVFILQNESGQLEYGLTDTVVSEIIEKFSI